MKYFIIYFIAVGLFINVMNLHNNKLSQKWDEKTKDAILYAYKSGCLETAELPIAECEMRSEEFYKETYESN